MNRTCSRGHAVGEDYLKVCPRCGAPVAGASGKVRSLAPERPPAPDVPRLKPFVFGGVVLLLFGILLTATAVSGPAEVFGYVLTAAGVVLAGLGIYDGISRARG